MQSIYLTTKMYWELIQYYMADSVLNAGDIVVNKAVPTSQCLVEDLLREKVRTVWGEEC